MKILTLGMTGAAVLLASCAANPPASQPVSLVPPANIVGDVHYSADDKARLGFCEALTETALIIATAKQAGKPAQPLKDYYATTQAAKVTVTLVDKIYADSFTNPWDYAVNFYDECLPQLTKVTEDRARPARYCAGLTLIAAATLWMRQAGQTREAAYQRFAPINSPAVRPIIDSIYDSAQTPALGSETKTWDACMGPISDKS